MVGRGLGCRAGWFEQGRTEGIFREYVTEFGAVEGKYLARFA